MYNFRKSREYSLIVHAVLEDDLSAAHHAQDSDGTEDQSDHHLSQALQRRKRVAERFRYLHHRRELSCGGCELFEQDSRIVSFIVCTYPTAVINKSTRVAGTVSSRGESRTFR